MRKDFIEELVALADLHDHIALVVGDIGYGVIEPFADRFPDRFINAGIAEQNMAGLAAGMASEGYHVFTYSIANFPTFRCAEQIRNDIAYHDLPVTVVAVGGGLAYGALGYSHHAVQDYALMRCMPGMTIAAPGDAMEVRACMRWLVANPGPSYLRIGKGGEPVYHDAPPQVSPGRWVCVRQGGPGDQPVALATGAALGAAVDRADGASVYSMPLWGMASKAAQPEIVARHRRVDTYEDHLLDGGFGAWMMEAMVGHGDLVSRIAPIALDPRVCGSVADQAALNRIGGLTL